MNNRPCWTLHAIYFTICFDHFFSLFENKERKMSGRKKKLDNENLHFGLQERIYHLGHPSTWHVHIVRLSHYIDPSVFHSARYRVACSIELDHLDVLTRQPWTNLSYPGQTLSFHRYPRVTRAKPGERSALSPSSSSSSLSSPFMINLWNNGGKVQKWTNETNRTSSLSIRISWFHSLSNVNLN